MNFSDTLDSIREINFLYLSMAQRLLLEDRAAGIECLGLSGEAADVVAALTLAQITRLAASSQMLCVFAQRSAAILAMLARDERGGPLREAVEAAGAAASVAS
ncbi:flagellar transcriptional activator FlhD [Trinickia terrae]|uniref:Flagellar transcriptional activator FlhD n=1 Tax=Trinickia terrae TaxID=2571161 RepID=A0A4U1ID69_9BURK|nr:flagellar transcriptional regulator FlhD [Trinickia terrae]TKC91497.1 flagellar transcriptional activator FlhD [Trinickia terrae]